MLSGIMVALGDNQQQRTLFAMAAHLLFGKRPDWHLIGVAALLLAVIATRAHSYLLFHTLVELFLIVVALTTFALAWNVRKHLDNPVLLLSSIALGPVAVLDALHMLAFKGMGVFPDDANLATQLWIAQRGLACAALLAAALLGPRRVSPQGALAVSTAFRASLAASTAGICCIPPAWLHVSWRAGIVSAVLRRAMMLRMSASVNAGGSCAGRAGC